MRDDDAIYNKALMSEWAQVKTRVKFVLSLSIRYRSGFATGICLRLSDFKLWKFLIKWIIIQHSGVGKEQESQKGTLKSLVIVQAEKCLFHEAFLWYEK